MIWFLFVSSIAVGMSFALVEKILHKRTGARLFAAGAAAKTDANDRARAQIAHAREGMTHHLWVRAPYGVPIKFANSKGETWIGYRDELSPYMNANGLYWVLTGIGRRQLYPEPQPAATTGEWTREQARLQLLAWNARHGENGHYIGCFASRDQDAECDCVTEDLIDHVLGNRLQK
jgi:hypothetical protein